MQRHNLLVAGCLAICLSGCCAFHHRPEIFKPPGLRNDAWLNTYGPVYQPTPMYPGDPVHRLTSLRKKKHRDRDDVYAATPYGLYPDAGAYPILMAQPVYGAAGPGWLDDCGCTAPAESACDVCQPTGAVLIHQPMLVAPGSQAAVPHFVPTPYPQQVASPYPTSPVPMSPVPMSPRPTSPMPMPQSHAPAWPMPMSHLAVIPGPQMPVTQMPMSQLGSAAQGAIADPACMAPAGTLPMEAACQAPMMQADPACNLPAHLWYEGGGISPEDAAVLHRRPVAEPTLNVPVPPAQDFNAPVELNLGETPSSDTHAKPKMHEDVAPLPPATDQSVWSYPIEIVPEETNTAESFPAETTDFENSPIETTPAEFMPVEIVPAGAYTVPKAVPVPGQRIVTRRVHVLPPTE